MENGADDMRIVFSPDDRRDRGLNPADLDAARELAEFHRLLAAELPPHSQLRGLMLRCAGHWSRLGAIPRNGLLGLRQNDEG